MSFTVKFAVAAFAASLVLAPAGFAEGRAEASAQPVSSRIAYGDLDTSTLAGGKALLNRIKFAARKVCDDALPRSPLHGRAVINCRHDTVETAVRQLDIGTLSLAWGGAPAATSFAAR